MKKLGKNLETVMEYIEAELAAKEAKIRQKVEKKEDEKREKEAAEARARKVRKKAEKARLEEKRVATMKKNMNVRIKLTVKDVMQNAWQNSELRDALIATKLVKKKKDYEFVSRGTEEIRERTESLTIHKKRKRGFEPVFNDSPPIELSPKRTVKRTPRRGIMKPVKLATRLTRSKTKPKVKLSPTTKEKFASDVKKTIPASIGVIGRYKYRDEVMKQIKYHDEITLQNLCNEEGILYNGKIEAIFDLADHQTYIAYGSEDEKQDVVEE
ncbi:hypothetical protein CBR_g52332 [Chara braunii]|uniref:Uncharacterized protein n=1 Tax=Chara braunii TaxID=69332 RepID=A0A388K6Q8_CHABU|nr:hypothetical protein CBR_g52332 [Chara braunii]|eukprot:GBG65740.1 hypothetical protein CBR_g52332 [Chara braunii]